MSSWALTKTPCLFPDYVAHCGMLASNGAADALPVEIQLPPRLRNAAPGRQAEYKSGRLCARKAIEILGAAAMEIPSGEDGNPLWPPGFIGSITHSGRHAFAAVTWKSKALGLGLDVEQIMSPSAALEVAPLVATSSEYQSLLKRSVDAELLTSIIFSAKEAIFKCMYPLLKFRFDFTDVEMRSIDEVAGTFSFALGNMISMVLPRSLPLTGKMAVADGFVHTGVVLPHP